MTLLCGGRKAWRAALCAVLIMTAASSGLIVLASAATTERIVTDRFTGLAISGFDPVAYFTDGKPKAGRADFELSGEGVVWRFANEGNRAAFEADPEIYMPQFGGYDPIAVARGVATAGYPEIWLISGDKLYFFYSVAARDAFTADPEGARLAADERWPQVLGTLVP